MSGVKLLAVGQEEREEMSSAGKLDSIVPTLWEINHNSLAPYESRGPDVQCLLALLSGSWAVCRVGRCQLDVGLPRKQLCHRRGWDRGRQGSCMEITSPRSMGTIHF